MSTQDKRTFNLNERASEFLNEYGHKITISIVQGFPKDGVDRFILRICGPRSTCENELTPIELKMLSQLLAKDGTRP